MHMQIIDVRFYRQHVGSRMDEYIAAGDTVSQSVQPQHHKRSPWAGQVEQFEPEF